MEYPGIVKAHLSGGRMLVSVLLPGHSAAREIEVPAELLPMDQRHPGTKFWFDYAELERLAPQPRWGPRA